MENNIMPVWTKIVLVFILFFTLCVLAFTIQTNQTLKKFHKEYKDIEQVYEQGDSISIAE